MTALKEETPYKLTGFSYKDGLGEIYLVIRKNQFVFGIYGKGLMDTGQAAADLSTVIKGL